MFGLNKKKNQNNAFAQEDSIWGPGKEVSLSDSDPLDRTVSVRSPGMNQPMQTLFQDRPVQDSYRNQPIQEPFWGRPVQDSFQERQVQEPVQSQPARDSIWHEPENSFYQNPKVSDKETYPDMVDDRDTYPDTVDDRDTYPDTVDDLNKTISVRSDYLGKIHTSREESGFLTVGWLVCIEGPGKGTDYRIRQGYNTVGRNESNDICIREDASISRIKDAVIAYASVTNRYTIRPEEGRNIIYINGEDILGATELHAYDKITIGQTVLLFVPLCNENFRW